MSITGSHLVSSSTAARAVELFALAVRVRGFAPDLQTTLLRLGPLAGPETWQGRVADVFWDEMLDQVRQLDRMGDLLAVVALRFEQQASELQTMQGASTGEGVLPG